MRPFFKSCVSTSMHNHAKSYECNVSPLPMGFKLEHEGKAFFRSEIDIEAYALERLFVVVIFNQLITMEIIMLFEIDR